VTIDTETVLRKLAREELERRKALALSRRKIDTFYPDEGPLRRALYPKHMQFFEAGLHFRQRAAIAANRVGKTEGLGGYEVAVHLTGQYPAWWPGRKWARPVDCLAGGDTGTTTRDIIAAKLLGPVEARGTGMIPGDAIVDMRPASGIPGGVDYAVIRHASGGASKVQFRSYDQGRVAWQGTERDIVWPDEEPPQDIYVEAITRTLTTKGMVIATFTPLKGMSEVVSDYLLRNNGTRYCVQIGWDDVPHISDKDKAEMLAEFPEHERAARARGEPMLGSGAIYRTPKDRVMVDPFRIPDHWPRAYGMDVGWNRTACVWGAWDRDSDTVYIIDEYYVGQMPPQVHSDAILARGPFVGAIDPASQGSNQFDGRKLMDEYQRMGLELYPADNAVEAGIMAMTRRLESGRLRIFSTCQNLLREYGLYRRDMNGKIVKENDHALDALRYLLMTGLKHARYATEEEMYKAPRRLISKVTGY
jgi:phage terminase large subunit-like protein